MKTYYCAQWPSLRIRHCTFVEGLFRTDNEAEQALIEGRPEFGLHITEVPAETPPVIAPTRARQGGINSRTAR